MECNSTNTTEDQVFSDLGTQTIETTNKHSQAHQLLYIACSQEGNDAGKPIGIYSLSICALMSYFHGLFHAVVLCFRRPRFSCCVVLQGTLITCLQKKIIGNAVTNLTQS